MLRYILFRLASALPSLLFITVLVFLVTYLAPGDPTMTLLGMEVTPQARAALSRKLGLDQPVHVRYAIWLGNVLQGDLGQSIFGQFPVGRLIASALPVSFELAVLGVSLALLIAIPAAVISALRHNTWLDVVITLATFAGLSLPSFWLAIMLIYLFAVNLRWLPAAGFVRLTEDPLQNLRHIVLPAVTLGIVYSTGLMRFLRAGLLDVMNQDYVQTARMKGVAEWRVLGRHVLKNALIPFSTVLSLELAFLLAGAFFIEVVFALPGMGRLGLNAILQRDYILVQGVVLVIATLFVVVNLLVDILYAWLDPRVRLGGKS
jgi:peptide/nickel transport system permease protein